MSFGSRSGAGLVQWTRLLGVSSALALSAALLPSAAAALETLGPLPYLSSADIPSGLYQGGAPVFLEDFEDQSLDGGISAAGGTSPPLFPTRTDSVDGDDGVIDGSGLNGTSWFRGDLGGFTEVVFTFSEPLPTAAGVVWTDGAAAHDVYFEVFGPGMTSLGEIGPFSLPDGVNTGETAEDRFFGARDPGGILAIRIANLGASGGIEVDHVQYGLAPFPSVPSQGAPGLLALAALGAALGVGAIARRSLGKRSASRDET